MRNVVTFLLIILFFNCSNHKQPGESQVSPSDTSSESFDVKIQATVDSILDEDCVFNDDIKGVTLDWIDEIKASGFVWNPEKNMAIKLIGDDSIKLWKGGCNHFYIHTEWSGPDTHNTTDSSYWISKALTIAEEYQLKDYVAFINEGRLQRDHQAEIVVVYNMLDTAQYTNTYYDGIVIEDHGQRKTLTLSSFYN